MGTCHTGADLEDVGYLNLDFGNNLLASFHLNWLSPVKIRHLIIGGSKKGLVYNDLNPWEPIKIYDRGITVNETEARRGVLISYRTGDIWSPQVEPGEPLQNLVRHFASAFARATSRSPTAKRASASCASSKRPSAASRPRAGELLFSIVRATLRSHARK